MIGTENTTARGAHTNELHGSIGNRATIATYSEAWHLPNSQYFCLVSGVYVSLEHTAWWGEPVFSFWLLLAILVPASWKVWAGVTLCCCLHRMRAPFLLVLQIQTPPRLLLCLTCIAGCIYQASLRKRGNHQKDNQLQRDRANSVPQPDICLVFRRATDPLGAPFSHEASSCRQTLLPRLRTLSQ